jgi:hypothetical protein
MADGLARNISESSGNMLQVPTNETLRAASWPDFPEMSAASHAKARKIREILPALKMAG